MLLRIICNSHSKLMICLAGLKQVLVLRLARIESLLIQIDENMYNERINLCNLLQYIGDGIESRELEIKEQLRHISLLEM